MSKTLEQKTCPNCSAKLDWDGSEFILCKYCQSTIRVVSVSRPPGQLNPDGEELLQLIIEETGLDGSTRSAKSVMGCGLVLTLLFFAGMGLLIYFQMN